MWGCGHYCRLAGHDLVCGEITTEARGNFEVTLTSLGRFFVTYLSSAVPNVALLDQGTYMVTLVFLPGCVALEGVLCYIRRGYGKVGVRLSLVRVSADLTVLFIAQLLLLV